jgi:hypothetical protein
LSKITKLKQYITKLPVLEALSAEAKKNPLEKSRGFFFFKARALPWTRWGHRPQAP